MMLEVSQIFQSLLPLAQIVHAEERTGLLGYHLMAVALFSFVGVIVLGVCLFLIDKLTPYSVVKEIVDEHNTAMAIIISAIVLGISMIISASILG